MSEQYIRTETYQFLNSTLHYDLFFDNERNLYIGRKQPSEISLIERIKEMQDEYLRRTK